MVKSPGLLSTLLHKPTHELLGVGLEHLVDVFQNRVDVLVELLLALGDVLAALDLGSLFGLRRLLRGLVLLATLSCHRPPPVRPNGRPCYHDPTRAGLAALATFR